MPDDVVAAVVGVSIYSPLGHHHYWYLYYYYYCYCLMASTLEMTTAVTISVHLKSVTVVVGLNSLQGASMMMVVGSVDVETIVVVFVDDVVVLVPLAAIMNLMILESRWHHFR